MHCSTIRLSISFYPRLREGGDGGGFLGVGRQKNVSTHASAREATSWSASCRFGWNVSTHASAREATERICVVYYCFQVSTHASAREATIYPSILRGCRNCFYPRLREGGDLVPGPQYRSSKRFLPTPPRGRRLTGWPCAIAVRGVSTHASAREATFPATESLRSVVVSTHASAREATAFAVDCAVRAIVSTHASAREATGMDRLPCLGESVSTHASAREATLTPPPPRLRSPRFYPRLREGGDWLQPDSAEALATFLPTPPRGRRPDGATEAVRRFDVSTHASAREATQWLGSQWIGS